MTRPHRASHRPAVALVCSSLLLLACSGHRTPTPPAATTAKPADDAPLAPDPELEQLLTDLGGSRDAVRRARDELRGRDPDTVLPHLLPLLEERRWRYRWEVANTLGVLHHPDAVPGLAERVIGDVDPHVRWRSLWALRECDREGAVAAPILLRALEEPDQRRQWNAAVGLGYFGDVRGLDLIHSRLVGGGEFRRREAVMTLRQVHDSRTSTRLEPVVFDDPKVRIRKEAVASLGYICDRKAKEILVRALDDPDDDLRSGAADAISRCGDADLAAALTGRREREPNEEVRIRIDRAHRRLTDPEASRRDRDAERETLEALRDSLERMRR